MDDLLDLNWSSSSTSQSRSGSNVPQKPASASTTSAFDFLSQPTSQGQGGLRSTTPNYYSSTPLRASTPIAAIQTPGVGSAINAPAANRLAAGTGLRAPGSGNATPLSGNGTPNIPQVSNMGGATSATGGGKGTKPNGDGGVGLDAFSSLLSISTTGTTPGVSKNMTMAEKQAAMVEEKRKRDEEDRKRFEAEGAFWDHLGGGGGSSGSSKPTTKTTTRGQKENDGLEAVLKPTPTPSAKPPASATRDQFVDILAPSPARGGGPLKSTSAAGGIFWNDYDDDLLTSAPAASAKVASSKSPAPPADPFDFDALASSTSAPASSVPSQFNGTGAGFSSRNGGSGMRTPVSDFDFEERDGEEEEDILGDLGRPVVARSAPVTAQSQSGPSRPTKKSAPRSVSPPPHIVGQIVEMGFSPAQARQALAKTSDGLDVQAAMEILLSGGSGSGSGQRSREDARRQEEFSGGEEENDDERIEYLRQRREEEEKERRRRRRAGPSRDSVRARTQEEREQERSETATPLTAAQAQEQAEKILAQASEIGQNMFSKATSFWNTGKEKAMKVYEEQRKALEAQAQAAGNASGGEGGVGRRQIRTDGKPRWMVEAEAAQAGEWDGIDDKEARGGDEGFRDDDDMESPPRRTKASGPTRPTTNGAGPSGRQNAPTSREQTQRPQKTPDGGGYRSAKERADLLFADEEPKRHISPARHLKPAAAATAFAPRAPPAAVVPAKPLPARQLISATPQQIQTSAAHKAKGNEHFKLGRFAEADSAYTSAISALPEGHLYLIPIHNNRAAARLKLGDSAPAAADCTIVINLIGPTYHPSKEAPLPSEVASEVKLGDGMVKAMIKRAQAWEMGEKWKNALEDWEKLLAIDAAVVGSSATATRNLAAEGARRARKMLAGGDGLKPASASGVVVKPKPKATSKQTAPPKPSDIETSAAVADLRKAAQLAEKEDEQRQSIKDTIETKINAWKSGKETNLRALIASLDMVLWDEIMKGGLKVGMHELITEKQVKIKYMKVVARLHPDKLNTQNTTVEQRMLANGAFGALSEAWQAFTK
ncbi:hypothetical protein IAR55_006534 [Kwoniella newhampshirensis]|uniref:UBA domain-containing protein n=1 Tax=Kwoniella newhampshirensis TaxID=1651941 RepID=A0AAW0YTZ7_9TREE